MRLIHSIVPWFSWSAFLLLQNHVVHCYKVLCSQDPQVYPPSTVHTPCYSTQWKTIVTFGDSWTDNGKGPLSETSYLNEDYLGRMSNGPTWAEYLSKSSGSDLYNFAFSGATANNKIIPRSTLDVGQQIQLFFMTTDTKQLDPLETLYILWIGVNDVHDMFVNNINSTDALEPIINSVISSIDEQMETLYHQASARHFFIMGLAPIDHLPLFNALTEQQKETLSQVIDIYNAKMLNLTQDLLQRYGSTSIQQLTGQKHLTAFVHPTFYFYPSSSLFTACFQDPSSYQLLDVVHSCRAGSHYTCRTPDRYLWWDDWHPTTHAQQIIAESVYSTVKAL